MKKSAPRRLPGNLEKALQVPIQARAQAIIDEPHREQFVQPHKWPEVLKLAQDFSLQLGWYAPRFVKPSPAVLRMVELLAAYDDEALKVAVKNAKSDRWLNEGSKGLSSLTVEVVGRLLSGRKPERDTGKPLTPEDLVHKRRMAQKNQELFG